MPRKQCPAKYHFHHRSETNRTLSLIPPHIDETRGWESSPQAAHSSNTAVSRHSTSLWQTCAPHKLPGPFSWTVHNSKVWVSSKLLGWTIYHLRYSRDKHFGIYYQGLVITSLLLLCLSPLRKGIASSWQKYFDIEVSWRWSIKCYTGMTEWSSCDFLAK